MNLRRHILPSLIENPQVDEIIISHGIPETYFHGFAKTRHFRHFIEQNHTGLLRKLTCATYANNGCVVIMDDDLIFEQPHFNRLLDVWNEDKDTLVGKFGRNCSKEKYKPAPVKENVAPIICGRIMVSSRASIINALNLAYLIDPMMADYPVRWNGEDIFLSLVTLLHTKRLNRLLHVPHKDLPSNDAVSANKDHYKRRDLIVSKCFKMLPGLDVAIGGGYFDS
jgi:hypothetical protein